MQLAGYRGRGATLARFSRSLILAALISVAAWTEQAAFAAVRLDLVAQDRGRFELAAPYGVAVDALGNFYVADAGKHRLVKFDSIGNPLRTIGSYGFGNGQLYSPQGVAVGEHSNGDTLIYVADTFNSRVMVFSDGGKYEDKFGANAPGGLNSPGGIGYLKNKSSPGGLVLVADTRNHRIVLFSDSGAYLKEYRCPTCPAGGIRPLGVSARLRPSNGTLQIFAVDELTSQIQVINSGGGWERSISERGTGEGQLQSPDDLAVDEDGNVWVADAGFAGGSTERISKFGPDGALLYSFRTTGTTGFTQPHGVALDQQGKIYVANSGGPAVYRFVEEAPSLFAIQYAGDPMWVNTKGAWFGLSYNGVEQTCRARGEATIGAPVGSPSPFTIDTFDSGPVVIDSRLTDVKMDMTTQQTNRVRDAWIADKRVSVSARFQARCEDGKLLQKTLKFRE